MIASITRRDNPLRGIFLMLASIASFACSDAASKIMTGYVSAIEVAWFRFLVFTLIVLSAAVASGQWTAFHSSRPTLQALRSVGVLGSAIFFIMGLALLPMAEATAIAFVSPLFVTALSIPVLGEIVGKRRWAAIGIGLIGVLIVIRPGTQAFVLASIFPLLSAASWAIALVITRRIGTSDGPIVSLAYAAVGGLAATTFMLPFVWVTPDWRVIGLGLTTGLFATMGHWLVILAFQNARASVLAPLSYSNLLWSGLLGFVVFGNVPDRWTIVGAAVITASGLYTVHRERMHAAPNRKPGPQT